MAQHLRTHLGMRGSVVVWNKAFEATRNREMGTMYPEYQPFFNGVNQRIFDLMLIFSKGYYIHPDFQGSASIKKVLPVLSPQFEGSYAALNIPTGDEAMLVWLEIIEGRYTPDLVETAKQDLLRYCELDTLAMVENWKVLQDLI